MKPIYAIADNIISPLGFGSGDNFSALLDGKSALKAIDVPTEEFTTYASFFNPQQLGELEQHADANLVSRFEKILYRSIAETLANNCIDAKSSKTIFIFATTKGNIELIDQPGILPDQLNLFHSAQKISLLFGNTNKPLVISNACISGLAAIITASRLLRAGHYENAVVCGADTFNNFVLSGFQSLKALSAEPCRPFDKDRTGVNLGEAAATLILSKHKVQHNYNADILICGGAISNDANHISGPSRTGDELALAINLALKESGLTYNDIDFVSAHGTATEYNDEMESKALTTCRLNEKPINSLKAYFGHTLGVAGLLESIIAIHSLNNNTIIKSRGYENCGTTLSLNICKTNSKKTISNIIKTTAGFGGCNAALVISKK